MNVRFDTVDVGHHHVGQHKLRPVPPGQLDRLLPGVRRFGDKAVPVEDLDDRVRNQGFVVDNKNTWRWCVIIRAISGLAGSAGLLLLLPEPMFGSWRFALALGAMPLLAGTGAALVDRQDQGPSPSAVDKPRTFPWQASALLMAAAILATFGLQMHQERELPAFSMQAATLDGLLAWVTLVVLQRLGAIRWTAQFLLVPVVTLIEGVVLLHPILDLRSWSGFALLAAGGVYLLIVGGQGSGTTS